MRAVISDKPAVGYALIGLVLAAAAYFAYSGAASGPKPLPAINRSYYMDLTSKELIPVDPGKPANVPLVKLENGGEAARAFVFACDACSEQTRFVGYLVKWEADARAAVQQAIENGSDEPERGMQIGAPDGSTWHNAGSKDADALIRSTRRDGAGRCAGKRLVKCSPPAVHESSD